jgi:hypothetical protein
MSKRFFLIVILLAAVPAWPQASTNADNVPNVDDRMLVPAPVSGEAYSIALDSGERSNYLHYGLTFGSAYSDNVLGATNGHAVSDISYSIWPTIGLNKTTPRLLWDATYTPGFTFYQRTSARNESDHNALATFQYRLSPHVTLNAKDSFQKSSNVLNQPGMLGDSVTGGAQGPNVSVIAPLADRLSNYANVGVTYQYGADDMAGVSGSFSNLHYANTAQVTGLSDQSSQGGSAFYSHRVAKKHYFGATYQYQRLLSYPSELNNETQTHAVFAFYTVYPSSRLSVSLFGGPQYEDTVQPALPSFDLPAYTSRSWNPAAGASLNWQGHFTSAAVSYSHVISGGGGLMGAVHLDQASASTWLQFTESLSGSISGFYANNNMVGPALLFDNGHTISGIVAMQRRFGPHLRLDLGYTRLHQSYSVPVLYGTPDTNREFISISYDFARPLGR